MERVFGSVDGQEPPLETIVVVGNLRGLMGMGRVFDENHPLLGNRKVVIGQASCDGSEYGLDISVRKAVADENDRMFYKYGEKLCGKVGIAPIKILIVLRSDYETLGFGAATVNLINLAHSLGCSKQELLLSLRPI